MVGEETTQYLKEVNKHLKLPKAIRKKLLFGLSQELEEHRHSPNDLEPPHEMAALLTDSVPKEIQVSYRRRRMWIARSIAALLAVMVFSFTGYLLWLQQTQVVRAEATITEQDSITEGVS